MIDAPVLDISATFIRQAEIHTFYGSGHHTYGNDALANESC